MNDFCNRVSVVISEEGNSGTIDLWWKLGGEASASIVGHEQGSAPHIDLWQKIAQRRILR
jgi:hypothetical protein